MYKYRLLKHITIPTSLYTPLFNMSIPEQFKKGYKPPFQEQPSAPGLQRKLDPKPLDDVTADGKPYKSAGKLDGRTALITGADSGIGRAVALLFGESPSRNANSGC